MKKTNFKKGFGILEVLIASTIIITILGALVTVGTMAINTNEQLLAKAQATNLAQEGIEMVRQIRDTNWIDNDNSTAWNSFVWGGSVSTPTLNIPTDSQNYKLSQNVNNKRWGLDPVNPDQPEEITVGNTKYTRSIYFDPIVNLIPSTGDLNSGKSQQAIRVRTKISWGSGQSIELSELITNWRPNF